MGLKNFGYKTTPKIKRYLEKPDKKNNSRLL
jgi:hypothetical protein